jgi:hypothetical protein
VVLNQQIDTPQQKGMHDTMMQNALKFQELMHHAMKLFIGEPPGHGGAV